MFLNERASLLLLIVTSALVAGVKHTKTDIPCIFDSDCGENDVKSSCVDNHCEFSHAPEARQVVTTLGAICRHNEECNIDGAICEDNLCTCTNETVSSFSKRNCVEEAKKIGDPCEEDIQCNFPQTTCRAKKCDCDPGFGVDADNDTQCKELNGIGNSCKKDEDCEVEHSKCVNETCDCTNSYSAYQKECYEISVTYSSKCDFDIQCQKSLGPDAICIQRTCHCKAKHIFSVLKNRCIEPTSLHILSGGTSTFSNGFNLFTVLSTLLMLRVRY